MKYFVTAVLALTFVAGAFAQGRGAAPRGTAPPLVVQNVHPPRTFGSPTGFGNILFPGMGTAPPLGPVPVLRPFGGGRGIGLRGGGIIPVPYAIPIYVPAYDGAYGYGYQQQPPPNITIVIPPQPSAPVVINQSFGPQSDQTSAQNAPQGDASGAPDSRLRYYQAPMNTPQTAAPQDEAPLVLIALRDSSVYSAVAYWINGDTLHYITPQGKHNEVSLALVDRDVSSRLNQGRKVPLVLPPPSN